jgi:hypothetical protein
MIIVDSIGQEYCLPCADSLEVEGVIVERESACVKCECDCDNLDQDVSGYTCYKCYEKGK